jgi:hypothetical protein
VSRAQARTSGVLKPVRFPANETVGARPSLALTLAEIERARGVGRDRVDAAHRRTRLRQIAFGEFREHGVVRVDDVGDAGLRDLRDELNASIVDKQKSDASRRERRVRDAEAIVFGSRPFDVCRFDHIDAGRRHRTFHRHARRTFHLRLRVVPVARTEKRALEVGRNAAGCIPMKWIVARRRLRRPSSRPQVQDLRAYRSADGLKAHVVPLVGETAAPEFTECFARDFCFELCALKFFERVKVSAIRDALLRGNSDIEEARGNSAPLSSVIMAGEGHI